MQEMHHLPLRNYFSRHNHVPLFSSLTGERSAASAGLPIQSRLTVQSVLRSDRQRGRGVFYLQVVNENRPFASSVVSNEDEQMMQSGRDKKRNKETA